jgi:hypothetical protein
VYVCGGPSFKDFESLFVFKLVYVQRVVTLSHVPCNKCQSLLTLSPPAVKTQCLSQCQL